MGSESDTGVHRTDWASAALIGEAAIRVGKRLGALFHGNTANPYFIGVLFLGDGEMRDGAMRV
jgi:hypothetical protein